MALVTGTVEGTNDKFGKFGMLVGGKWYNTKLEWAPSPAPKKGDAVEFDDGDKNYIKRLKIVGAGGGTSSAPKATGGGTPAKSGFRQAGTEGGFPLHPMAYERALDRRVCVAQAVEIVKELGPARAAEDVGLHPDSKVFEIVIATARELEDYTTGTLDAEIAKQMIENGEV